jgi:hypothetical protein
MRYLVSWPSFFSRNIYKQLHLREQTLVLEVSKQSKSTTSFLSSSTLLKDEEHDLLQSLMEKSK